MNSRATSAIIALGRSLELDVIAEGLETSEQAHILMRHGCFLAQGYLYSRPIAPEDFQQFHNEQLSSRRPSEKAGAGEGGRLDARAHT